MGEWYMTDKPLEKTFVLSAQLSKIEYTGTQVKTHSSMMMGLRRCATLEEAKGSFVLSVLKEKPGFAIDEILSMEIEDA
jgi:hypothetical protein